MKASSESGLWALTISWGATVVIRGTLSLHYREVEACEWMGRGREKIEKKKVRHPPRSGWLDELGRLKDGRSIGLGVARCAPYWVIQNCPAAPSAVSCSRTYVRTCSSSNPTVDTA